MNDQLPQNSLVYVMEEVRSRNTLVTFVMLGLGPVLIPPDSLPDLMLTLGALSPATFTASALQQTLLGPVITRIWLDLLVLAGSGVLIFWSGGIKLDWPNKVNLSESQQFV